MVVLTAYLGIDSDLHMQYMQHTEDYLLDRPQATEDVRGIEPSLDYVVVCSCTYSICVSRGTV